MQGSWVYVIIPARIILLARIIFFVSKIFFIILLRQWNLPLNILACNNINYTPFADDWTNLHLLMYPLMSSSCSTLVTHNVFFLYNMALSSTDLLRTCDSSSKFSSSLPINFQAREIFSTVQFTSFSIYFKTQSLLNISFIHISIIIIC